MAIGLRVHSTFTITQLFDTLCTQNCNTCAGSGILIDMRLLRRTSRECSNQEDWYLTEVHLERFFEYLRHLLRQSQHPRSPGSWNIGEEKGELLLDERVACVEVPWLKRNGMGMGGGPWASGSTGDRSL
jgi:hypothetical protein